MPSFQSEAHNNYNKIRKRGCNSSSSSSSLVRRRRYRFKRAILVGKKGGSSTPVPLWKTMTPTATSPSVVDNNTHHHHQIQQDHVTKQGTLHTYGPGGVPFIIRDKELSVSARKLAATLWEINDFPPSKVKKEFDQMNRGFKETIGGREKGVSLSRSGLLQQQQQKYMSDPSHSPNSERMEGFEHDSCKRGFSALSYQLQSGDTDYYLDTHRSSSLIEEVENRLRNKDCGKYTVGVKNRLKEARSGLSTLKKILKVLNQMCLREHNSSSMPLVLALGSEIDRVCHQIDQLIQEQRANQNDVEYVMKCFAEEKASWKRREREKIHDAVKNVAEELEVEKKLRRQTERLNKKIAREMATAKASHLKVSKELEKEKRAKDILEQICDELARGIGEDRAHVEELKRESAKVRKEVEKEREMLQLADVLRQEQVQMKLSEAKYQFEEKNAVLEKLRNDLEGFMRTKEEEKEENGAASPKLKKNEDLESYFNYMCEGFCIRNNAVKVNNLDVGDVVQQGDSDDDSDDDDSDLHSIELNMDNENKGYKWSYAKENAAAKDESKRVSTDKESIGRKSLSEKIQWGSICFNKGTTSKRDFGINIHENFDHLGPEKSIEFISQVQRKGQSLTLQYSDEETEENGGNLVQKPAGRNSGI